MLFVLTRLGDIEAASAMPPYCADVYDIFLNVGLKNVENTLIACVLCLHPPFWERFRYQTLDTVCRIIKVIRAAGTVSTLALNLLRARKATFAEGASVWRNGRRTLGQSKGVNRVSGQIWS